MEYISVESERRKHGEIPVIRPRFLSSGWYSQYPLIWHPWALRSSCSSDAFLWLDAREMPRITGDRSWLGQDRGWRQLPDTLDCTFWYKNRAVCLSSIAPGSNQILVEAHFMLTHVCCVIVQQRPHGQVSTEPCSNRVDFAKNVPHTRASTCVPRRPRLVLPLPSCSPRIH